MFRESNGPNGTGKQHYGYRQQTIVVLETFFERPINLDGDEPEQDTSLAAVHTPGSESGPPREFERFPRAAGAPVVATGAPVG